MNPTDAPLSTASINKVTSCSICSSACSVVNKTTISTIVPHQLLATSYQPLLHFVRARYSNQAGLFPRRSAAVAGYIGQPAAQLGEAEVRFLQRFLHFFRPA